MIARSAALATFLSHALAAASPLTASTATPPTSIATTPTSTAIDSAAAPHLHAISFSLPALDGLRGIQTQYERWLPDRRISLAGSVQFRETAIGDYTSLRVGVGAELRRYWRARAKLSNQVAGSMVGWFYGGRVDALVERTHDELGDRHLGTTIELGATLRLGYRIAPWRSLEITPSISADARVDLATSGRVPAWWRPGVGFGLTAGWLF